MRSGSRPTCGSQVTVKELDSGIEIVHGWFTERGDSIFETAKFYGV